MSVRNRLRAIMTALVLSAAFAHVDAQATIISTTEWHGTLATPTGKLPLLVRIRTAADSSHTGELEDIAQAPGKPIPLGAVSVTATALSFTIPMVGARYDAQWHAADSTWVGTFRQGAELPLILSRGAPPSAPVLAGVDGTWRGTLQRDATRLHLVLHVATTARGTRATLDSPDVGAMGLGVDDLARTGDSVRFVVGAAQVTYDGIVHDGTIIGTWTRLNQPPATVTFVRDSSARADALVRTQWPITAKGYSSTDVAFANPAAAGVTLAGTLTVPEGRGPFPAAILISGSGPQDRDETLFDHKPFAVLADYLSRHGIAVLRYDDRGFAKSTGNHMRATSADFASDARAAITFLRTRPDLDPRAIGIIGHSEGGLIGPMVAVADPRVRFLVLLAGPGTTTTEVMRTQAREMAVAEGMPAAQATRAQPLRDSLFALIRNSSPDSATATRELRDFLADGHLAALGVTTEQRAALVAEYARPWWRYFLRHDPATTLARVRVPVLALNGARDRQVSAAANLPAIRAALAHDRDVTIRELPDLNHLFQHATTGAASEYRTIAETFAPDAMAVVRDWIAARFSKR